MIGVIYRDNFGALCDRIGIFRCKDSEKFANEQIKSPIGAILLVEVIDRERRDSA